MIKRTVMRMVEVMISNVTTFLATMWQLLTCSFAWKEVFDTTKLEVVNQ